MPEPNLFQIFTSRLDRAGIGYMVTGAAASIIYGEPRLTHDIDLVVELSKSHIEKILEAFPSEEFYCPPPEVIGIESSRTLRGHFNLIHHESGFKADVYTVGEDEFHHWAMSKRRQIEVKGNTIWVAPPEYVIVRKLEYYREGHSHKHLRDIAGMIELSHDEIDFGYLEERIEKHALQKEWNDVQKLVT
jgi:hypothetical protein